jgi:hypothetical protein
MGYDVFKSFCIQARLLQSMVPDYINPELSPVRKENAFKIRIEPCGYYMAGVFAQIQMCAE